MGKKTLDSSQLNADQCEVVGLKQTISLPAKSFDQEMVWRSYEEDRHEDGHRLPQVPVLKHWADDDSGQQQGHLHQPRLRVGRVLFPISEYSAGAAGGHTSGLACDGRREAARLMRREWRFGRRGRRERQWRARRIVYPERRRWLRRRRAAFASRFLTGDVLERSAPPDVAAALGKKPITPRLGIGWLTETVM